MKLDERRLQKTGVIVALAILANFLWGSAAPCIKTGYRLFQIPSEATATQILFAGCRFTLAGILGVFLGSFLNGSFLKPSKKALPKVAVLSMLQTVIQYGFYYIGLAHTTGVKASIVTASNVFIGILIASLLFRQEKLTPQKILGCLIGFAGVVVVNVSSGSDLNLQMSLAGEGCIFMAAVAYSFSYVTMKYFSASENPIMLSNYQFVLGGIIMIVLGLLSGGRITMVTGRGILMLGYLAMVSAVAYSVWSLLLKYNPVSRVTVFGFMNPVFGVLLSALMLGESGQAFGTGGLIALILVCVGIYIVNRGKPAGRA